MFSLKNPVTGLLRQQVETGLNEREKEMFVQEKLLDVHLSVTCLVSSQHTLKTSIFQLSEQLTFSSKTSENLKYELCTLISFFSINKL